MDFKIQEYYGRCDKLFLQNATEEAVYKQVRKYVKDMIRFILVREGILTLEDITKYTFEDIFKFADEKRMFPKAVTTQFFGLLKNYVNKNSLENIEFVRRSVYQKYLRLFSRK